MATIIKTVKQSEYSSVSKYHLTDRRLSWKAKGLLTALLSLSGEYTIDELVGLTYRGNQDTREAIAELEKNEYLIWKQVGCNGNGDPEIGCIIYERPMQKKPFEYPVGEYPNVGETPGNTLSPENIEEEKQLNLRERLNLKKVSEKCSENFVEMVFKELCRRDAEFCQMMTAKAFELVCLTAWEQQRNKSINELSELINGYFDNVVLGIRSASGGNSPVVQKEMIENSLMYGYHRDK